MIYPAFAAEYDLNSYHADDDSNESSEYSQIVSTSDGTLDVGIYTTPKIPNTDEFTKLMISFLKPDTERIQQHIDYRVSVTKDGDYVFGPMSRLLHTSPGSITIPVKFSENGSHIVHIEVEGILFQPIPLEIATLTINVGQAETSIPGWIKNNAGWWADNKINDNDFISGIEYLIENKIIKVSTYVNKENSTGTIPSWIKNNAGWWSAGQISDEDFLSGIKYLIENNVIKVNAPINSELVQKELKRKAWNFEQYLKNIQNDIKNQNRYVENINPSEYVIVKYWKDYHKWNLEQYLDKPEIFPDRNVWIDPETDRYVIEYKVHINDQPPGLPIDHVSTLENSFSFWEKYEFNTTDGKKAVVNFDITGLKGEANVWVTWVVRSLGEDVLGHATLGKGVVEVAIGNYGCDGSFQLFGINTVEQIMTHELGHSISLGHSTNPESMMYPSISNTGYAYCLLN